MKIATGIRPPRTLTDEDYAQVREETQAVREAFEKATSGMERLTPEDIKVVIR
jgi:hypothetical protein